MDEQEAHEFRDEFIVACILLFRIFRKITKKDE